MKFREWLFNEANRQKIVMFHGTIDSLLPTILSQGLIPDPKKRSWDVDPNASFQQPSRASIGGIYVTSNLMTALSSATRQNVGTNKNSLVVILSLEPKTLIMDEDDISFGARQMPSGQGLVGLHTHEYSLANVYSDYVRLQHDDFSEHGEYADYYKQQAEKNVKMHEEAYVQHMLEYVKHIMQGHTGEIHPQLETRLIPLFHWGFYVTMARSAAYLKPDSFYSNFSILKKYPLPSPVQAEADFKKYQDQLTRSLKRFSQREPKSEYQNLTARVMEPIGYNGANRIIGIARVYYKPSTMIEKIFPKDGDLPQEFLSQFASKVSNRLQFVDQQK